MRRSPGAKTDGSGRTRVTATGAAVALLIGGLSFAACGDDDSPGRTDAQPKARRAQASPRPSPTPPTAWDRTPESLAAVGDSISRGFDACSLLSDCPEVSWATGVDPDIKSLARQLLERPRKQSWNVAKTGAVMADLPAQMERAAAHDPDMVTVMAGSNDACQPSAAEMTPVAEFRTDFEEALRTLRREQPKTQVYVSSVPNLKRLWSEGRKDRIRMQVWRLGICQSMLQDPNATGKAAVDRRQQVYDRVVAYNTVLEEVCAEDELCRYDGGAVFDYRFTGDELSSWDWFHPSKQGQRKLAELAYRQITAS
ncbi:SGNH/GDSL hydrolase family protein [Streptomyces sp. N2-109]|uniref:SGNH/GDSL hydrolase family protein n=1 Tax=Streptomyces gossypii TaxID=2883101 RepID=A0ABT2JQW2_9ACTN|nr:SGNH/GDSL hydrolase family protein [Streptomyces gossypii]MCT2590272.1 SGNH/GDSL hydrolase family protein [Streptomyces gossypii]